MEGENDVNGEWGRAIVRGVERGAGRIKNRL